MKKLEILLINRWLREILGDVKRTCEVQNLLEHLSFGRHNNCSIAEVGRRCETASHARQATSFASGSIRSTIASIRAVLL